MEITLFFEEEKRSVRSVVDVCLQHGVVQGQTHFDDASGEFVEETEPSIVFCFLCDEDEESSCGFVSEPVQKLHSVPKLFLFEDFVFVGFQIFGLECV